MQHDKFHQEAVWDILNGINIVRPEGILLLQLTKQLLSDIFFHTVGKDKKKKRECQIFMKVFLLGVENERGPSL